MALVTFDRNDMETLRKIAREEANNEINKRLSSAGAPRRGDKWEEWDDSDLRRSFAAYLQGEALTRGRSTSSIIARLRLLEVL